MKRIALISMLMLAGCAETPTQLVELRDTQRPDVPDSLLTCEAAPEVPSEGSWQSEVARYVLDLFGAGEDCRQKLGAVRDILKLERPAGVHEDE
jgi:hypothetical protein